MDTDQYLIDQDESLDRCDQHLATFKEKTDVGLTLTLIKEPKTKSPWWHRLLGVFGKAEENPYGS